jgi:topoisomerase-4 subunit B
MPARPKTIQDLLEFYMGKNTPERQDFIIKNLKVELDLIEEETDERAELPEASAAA